jgi:peptide/nickel transport system permease protein
MLAEGRDFVNQAPWMGIFPGIAIFFTVLAFNFVGDGLRDALDPKQKSVIESRGRAV